MKASFLAKLVFGASILCLAGSTAWARLPRPYQHEGVVASVDSDSRVIALVQPPKPKFRLGKIVKPTTFVWNENTHFIKNGQPVAASALSSGAHARLHYWYPPKNGRPFLVKVLLENGSEPTPATSKKQ